MSSKTLIIVLQYDMIMVVMYSYIKSIAMRKSFLSFVFISGLFICPAAIASTNVGGSITSNTTWNLAGSPYILTDRITIRSSATLTIEPGVEVQLGGHYIRVGYASSPSPGYLHAEGATFTGTSSPGVYFVYGSGQQLTNCFFDGTNILVGYSPYTVSVTISGGTIQNANGYGVRGDYGTVNISDVTIQNNGSYGIYLKNTNSNITNCVISGHDYPYYFCGGNQTLSGNNISGNNYAKIATGSASGSMSSDSTWRSSWGLPIVLLSKVAVANSATLTIEPGVEVQLGSNYIQAGLSHSYSNRYGYLHAEGATFTGTGSLGIYFVQGTGQQLTNCTFDGKYIQVGYSPYTVSVTISGGTIQNANGYGVRGDYGTVNISDVTIQNNGTYGIYLSNTSANITNCFISGGSTALQVANGTATCRYCSFVDESSYGVYANSSGSVDARWCYWGSADGPGPIGPGSGTNVSTNVEFEPWLGVPTPSYPVSGPVTGTATQAGSGLGETDPNKMVQITNADTEIKFVPLVSGGGSITITELSCHTIEGDGVVIIPDINGLRGSTTLGIGEFVAGLKFLFTEQDLNDLPAGWTERDLRIAQLQAIASKGPGSVPRWAAEWALEMLPEPIYGPPTLNVGDWGIDEEGNYVWANVDHFSDYAVGVKLGTGNFDGDRDVDFVDFATFASHWQDVNCPSSDWCFGADFDLSTTVDFADLALFVYDWLYDANDPNTW